MDKRFVEILPAEYRKNKEVLGLFQFYIHSKDSKWELETDKSLVVVFKRENKTKSGLSPGYEEAPRTTTAYVIDSSNKEIIRCRVLINETRVSDIDIIDIYNDKKFKTVSKCIKTIGIIDNSDILGIKR